MPTPENPEALRVSRHLVAAVKCSDEPAYAIAKRAGITGPVLSGLLHGALAIHEGDPRVLAVARAVGLPEHRAFARTRR